MVIVQQLFLNKHVYIHKWLSVSNINFIFFTVNYHSSFFINMGTYIIGSRIEFSNLEAESRATANCANVIVKNY